MSREVQRFLAFLGATAALALVLGVVGLQLLGGAAGPDAAIVTRLKKIEQTGLEDPLAWGTFLGAKLQFQRISVVFDADGESATVTSTLDLVGEVRRGPGDVTKLSSLGLERARFKRVDGEWEPDGLVTPRLLSIVDALEQRRLALERGDALPDGGVPWPELRKRRYRSEAWFIRSEREDVTVTEDARLQGDQPDRPVDEKSTRRLSLHEDSAGRFSFPDGIM